MHQLRNSNCQQEIVLCYLIRLYETQLKAMVYFLQQKVITISRYQTELELYILRHIATLIVVACLHQHAGRDLPYTTILVLE